MTSLAGPSSDAPQPKIDFELAQQEVFDAESGADPIQNAIAEIERTHERDKEDALKKQREKYEEKLRLIKDQIRSPMTPSAPPAAPYAMQGGYGFAEPWMRSSGDLRGSISNLTQIWAEERYVIKLHSTHTVHAVL